MTKPVPIVRFAARGDGVAADGRYVPGAVPGDLVEGEQLRPGGNRALPPCRHFGACGGCQLQHAGETVLGDFVRGRVLAALGGVGIVPGHVHEPHLSPPGSRRRAAMRTVRTREGVLIGFNREASHQIVDITECHVVTPSIFALVQMLGPLLTPLLPGGAAAGVTITETLSGFDILIANAEFDTPGAGKHAADWAASNGVARLSVENGGGLSIIVQYAEPVVELGGVRVVLPPAAFLQATLEGEAALTAAVLQSCSGASRIADLFSGVGTFALPLSAAARVLAADAAGPAIAAMEKAARSARRPIETMHRDLFRRPLSAKELSDFDAVVFDPPRAGAKAQVGELARSGVPRIVAVSCNPSTFARDAAALGEAGYRLTQLWPVGQFRWSTHVELAALFER